MVGTDPSFFRHYRFAGDRALTFAAGGEFTTPFQAVLGADVAGSLKYRLGQHVVLAHGAGEVNLMEHTNMPLQVSGILARTGTPLILLDPGEPGGHHGDPYRLGGRRADARPARDGTGRSAYEPDAQVRHRAAGGTQFEDRHLPGAALHQRLPRRAAAGYSARATLQELWDLVGVGERLLLAVSAFVVIVGMAGLLTVLLAGLEARRREMAVLRSVGAHPRQILGLILGETAAMTLAGIGLGVLLLYGLILALRPLLESQWGIYLGLDPPSLRELGLLGAVFAVGLLSGPPPAWLAYRRSLADGLTVRL